MLEEPATSRRAKGLRICRIRARVSSKPSQAAVLPRDGRISRSAGMPSPLQSADHGDGETTLAVQYFRNPRTRTDERFQILAGQLLLFHAKPDGRNRVRRVYRIVLRFSGIDQCSQDIEPISVCRSTPGSPKPLDFGDRLVVIGVRSDGFQISGHASPPWRRCGRSPCALRPT